MIDAANDNNPVIAVLSHSGGAGRTTLSAMLAVALARASLMVTLVDLCQAGGAAWLERNGQEPNVRPWIPGEPLSQPRTFLQSRVALLHYPQGYLHQDPIPALEDEGLRGLDSAVVFDTPTFDLRTSGWLLRRATLVIVPVLCDALAFRTMIPFLQALQEERARPNRSFQIRAVLNGTGAREPEAQLIEAHMRSHLAPLLLRTSIPLSPVIHDIADTGTFPETGQAAGGGALLDSLANELLTLPAVV
jgi:cellulose biosynthesis protein BcsQ